MRVAVWAFYLKHRNGSVDSNTVPCSAPLGYICEKKLVQYSLSASFMIEINVSQGFWINTHLYCIPCNFLWTQSRLFCISIRSLISMHAYYTVVCIHSIAILMNNYDSRKWHFFRTLQKNEYFSNICICSKVKRVFRSNPIQSTHSIPTRSCHQKQSLP